MRKMEQGGPVLCPPPGNIMPIRIPVGRRFPCRKSMRNRPRKKNGKPSMATSMPVRQNAVGRSEEFDFDMKLKKYAELNACSAVRNTPKAGIS